MIVTNNGVVDDDDLVLPPCSREHGMAPNPEWGCSDSGSVGDSSLRNKRPDFSGRPPCKGVAIGVARRDGDDDVIVVSWVCACV